MSSYSPATLLEKRENLGRKVESRPSNINVVTDATGTGALGGDYGLAFWETGDCVFLSRSEHGLETL